VGPVACPVSPLQPVLQTAPADAERSEPLNDASMRSQETNQHSVLVGEVEIGAQPEIVSNAVRGAPQVVAPTQEIPAEQRQSAAYYEEKVPEEGVLGTTQPKAAHLTRPHGFLMELFWNAAVVAVAAALALLLGTSFHRFSPFPAGLPLPSELVRQPVPFQRKKYTVRIPALTSSVGTETVATKLPAVTKGLTPTVPPAVTDPPSANGVSLASTQGMIVNPDSRRTDRSRAADIVARDTVIHYRIGSAAPRSPAQKKP
jgi:hypothetical protein